MDITTCHILGDRKECNPCGWLHNNLLVRSRYMHLSQNKNINFCCYISLNKIKGYLCGYNYFVHGVFNNEFM